MTRVPAPAAQTLVLHPAAGSGLTACRIVRSEWVKLRTVRSTTWSFGAVIAVSVVMAVLMTTTGFYGEQMRSAEQQNAIALRVATFGVYFGQLIMAVLGVLVITGEYGTGMIRSTLTAVPNRIPAIIAKAAVLFASSFVVGLIAVFASYLVASPILAAQDISSDLDGVFIGNLLLSAFYLALTSVFALGVGTAVRSSAGGLATALGVVLLLPIGVTAIAVNSGAQWAMDVSPYLFSTAGYGMYIGGSFERWQFGLIVGTWTMVSLVLGLLLLKRRDV